MNTHNTDRLIPKKKQRPLIHNYNAISNEKRQHLIRLVVLENVDVKEASECLQINSYSAKSILRRYTKTGTIYRKNKIAKLNSTNQKQIIEFLSLDQNEHSPYDPPSTMNTLGFNQTENTGILATTEDLDFPPEFNPFQNRQTSEKFPQDLISNRQGLSSQLEAKRLVQGLPQNFNSQSEKLLSFQQAKNSYSISNTSEIQTEKSMSQVNNDLTNSALYFDFHTYTNKIETSYHTRHACTPQSDRMHF